jgi:hypothetical protein
VRLTQRLVEIGQDVVDVLDPDAESDIVLAHATGRLLARVELRLGRGRGVDGGAAGVTDIGGMVEQLQRIDEPPPSRVPPLSSKPTSPP